jgi:hypothetical protein
VWGVLGQSGSWRLVVDHPLAVGVRSRLAEAGDSSENRWRIRGVVGKAGELAEEFLAA